jgi:hypothetical protein
MILSQILEDYAEVKRKLDYYQKTEQLIKAKLHKLMDKNQCHELEDGTYLCYRKYQKRESIQKTNVPSDIWNKYKKTTEFDVLYIRERK